MKKRGFKASHAIRSSYINTKINRPDKDSKSNHKHYNSNNNHQHTNNLNKFSNLSKFLDKHVFHSTDGERFILILFVLFLIMFVFTTVFGSEKEEKFVKLELIKETYSIGEKIEGSLLLSFRKDDVYSRTSIIAIAISENQKTFFLEEVLKKADIMYEVSGNNLTVKEQSLVELNLADLEIELPAKQGDYTVQVTTSTTDPATGESAVLLNSLRLVTVVTQKKTIQLDAQQDNVQAPSEDTLNPELDSESVAANTNNDDNNDDNNNNDNNDLVERKQEDLTIRSYPSNSQPTDFSSMSIRAGDLPLDYTLVSEIPDEASTLTSYKIIQQAQSLDKDLNVVYQKSQNGNLEISHTTLPAGTEAFSFLVFNSSAADVFADPVLLDKTALEQDGYLKDDNVKIIVQFKSEQDENLNSNNDLNSNNNINADSITQGKQTQASALKKKIVKGKLSKANFRNKKQKIVDRLAKVKEKKQITARQLAAEKGLSQSLSEPLKTASELASQIEQAIKDLDVIDSVAIEIGYDELTELSKDAAVEKIYLDKKVEAILDKSVPLINATYLWQLKDFLGNNITGKDIIIAVIDTGVDYTNLELGGCFGAGCKVIGGYDFANNDADPMDDHGHGTHVAATAAGFGTNGTLIGVAPDAKILAYKVLSSSGSGSFSNVIAGIQRAADPDQNPDTDDGADIITMSLGGTGNPDDAPSMAIDAVVDAGIVATIAAGNSGPIGETILSPGTSRKAITVGASDDNDAIASFSSRGPVQTMDIKPEVTAPGVGICAAQWDSWREGSNECSPAVDKHISISGTSMATPHVAGAVALLKQAYPSWTAEQIKSVLVNTAKDLGYSPTTQGGGRINLANAYNAEIYTSPSVLNFGSINSTVASLQFNIMNILDENIDIVIDAGAASDGTKSYTGMASVDSSSFTLKKSDAKTVTLTFDTKGNVNTFYGYLKIYRVKKEGKDSVNSTAYSLPYYLTQTAKLTVNVVDERGLSLDPSLILIHSADLKTKQTTLDPYNGKATYTLLKGNYTVHAIGENYNYNLSYVLSKHVSLFGNQEVTFNVSAAKKYIIPARTFDNRVLDLYQWDIQLYLNYNNTNILTGKYFIGAAAHGDRTIYLIDDFDTLQTASYPYAKSLIISYLGVPDQGHKKLSLYGTETDSNWREHVMAGAEEMYVSSWIINNSNIEFAIDKKDYGNYTYHYNYPAEAPQIGAAAEAYLNYIVVYSPRPVGVTLWSYDVYAPLVRKVYAKANGLGFRNYLNINYLRLGSSGLEFAATKAQREDYSPLSGSQTGFNPKAGDNIEFYFGTAPYLLPKFNMTSTRIEIKSFSDVDSLVSVNKGKSYLYKDQLAQFSGSNGVERFNFDAPTLKLYGITESGSGNNKVVTKTFLENRSLYFWKGYSRYEVSYPKYAAILDAVNHYPIYNHTTIYTEFLRGEYPPHIAGIEIPTAYLPYDEITLLLNISTDTRQRSLNLVKTINVSYLSAGSWEEVSTFYAGDGVYGAKFNMSESSLANINKLILQINITDQNGNLANYFISPVSLPARTLSLTLDASKKNISAGDKVAFTGTCKDNLNIQCFNFMLKFYLDNDYVGFMNTQLSDGKFVYNWTVPDNFNANDPNKLNRFYAKFAGTGVYLPKTVYVDFSNISVSAPKNETVNETNKTLPPSDTLAPIISSLQRTPSIIYNTNSVTLSANATDETALSVVQFSHNASGTMQLFDLNSGVTNSGNTYSYTISSSLLSNQEVVGWKVNANDTSNNKAQTAMQSFKVENRNPSITPFSAISVNETDIIILNPVISDPDNDPLTVTYTAPFNSSGIWATKIGDAGSGVGEGTKYYYSTFSVYDGMSYAWNPFYVDVKQIDVYVPNITSINNYPQIVYKNSDVVLSAKITDYNQLADMKVYHNASGKFEAYNEITGTGNYYTYNFSDYFSKNKKFKKNDVIGYMFYAKDSKGNEAYSAIKAFTVLNRKPKLAKLPDLFIEEGRKITLIPAAIDEDGDEVIYTFSSPFVKEGAKGTWQTKTGDAGEYTIRITATDSDDSDEIQLKIKVKAITKQMPDFDRDGIPDEIDTDDDNDNIPDPLDDDDDNDGVKDNEDKIRGDAKKINTTFSKINVSIGNDYNLNKPVTGKQEIKIEDSGIKLVEFKFDFSSLGQLLLDLIKIEKQKESAKQGAVLVSGINLSSAETKTIYMDRLNKNSSRICLKDADVDSLDEITSTCTGENETKLGCNSTLQNGYNCTIIDSGARYLIQGLKHSAAQEFCTDNDEDGYGEGCVQQDCNDNNAAINPGASEIAYNRIDEDCSGSDLTDVDSDSYNAVVVGGNDCNDANSAINPAATDVCGNSVDEDCSGADLACPITPPPSEPTPPPSEPPVTIIPPTPPSSGGGGSAKATTAQPEEPFVIISREVTPPFVPLPSTQEGSQKSGARDKDKTSSQERDSDDQAGAAKSLAQKVKETYVVNKTAAAVGKVTVEAKKTGYFTLNNLYFVVLISMLFMLSVELSRRIKKRIYGK